MFYLLLTARYGCLYIDGIDLVNNVFDALYFDIIYKKERDQELELESDVTAPPPAVVFPPPESSADKFAQRKAQLIAARAVPSATSDDRKTFSEQLKEELKR